MFVLSRKKDESVFIDEIKVTVGWISHNKAQLVISDPDQTIPMEQILYVEDRIHITDEISIILIRITEDKVRLGIEAPRDTHIERIDDP